MFGGALGLTDNRRLAPCEIKDVANRIVLQFKEKGVWMMWPTVANKKAKIKGPAFANPLILVSPVGIEPTTY